MPRRILKPEIVRIKREHLNTKKLERIARRSLQRFNDEATQIRQRFREEYFLTKEEIRILWDATAIKHRFPPDTRLVKYTPVREILERIEGFSGKSHVQMLVKRLKLLEGYFIPNAEERISKLYGERVQLFNQLQKLRGREQYKGE